MSVSNPKYKTNEDVQILGVALLAISDNRKVSQFDDLVHEYRFEDVDPEKWYSFQQELNFMKTLADRMNSTSNMVAIGIEIFEKLVIPPDIHTLEDGINMLNSIIDLNMRNVPQEYRYIIKKIGKNHLRVTDNTPFPHDLVYGYLHGLCKALLPIGKNFAMTCDYINPSNPDAAGAVYNITWDA